jgi:hypothetical protein
MQLSVVTYEVLASPMARTRMMKTIMIFTMYCIDFLKMNWVSGRFKVHTSLYYIVIHDGIRVSPAKNSAV